MAASDDADDRPEPARRAAAVGALVLVVAALAIAAVGLVGDLGRLVLTPVLLLMVTATAWVSATRTGMIRIVAAVATVVLLGLVVAVVLTAEGHGRGPRRRARAARRLPPSSSATRSGAIAGRCESQPAPGIQVDPAEHGVLIMNLRSGGGKAERFALVEECRRRGIEPVVLQPGDDLLELARTRDRPWRRRDRHGGRGRVPGAGRLGGDGGRRAARLRPGRHAQPLRPRPRASTATMSSPRSTPSTPRSSGASTSPR